jgi:methylglutaconyl-CoA hydratase
MPFFRVGVGPLHCGFVTAELMHVVRRGPVCTLTLDSPHNRNALSAQLIDELADGLAETVADETVRVVILTATGSVFCSGADLSERTAPVTSRLPEILSTLRAAPMPVVARVGGHARAGGIGLIAASDLAVATARSTLAFSEVRIGVAPAMILVPALRVADRRFLQRATLTGELFSALAAASAGLLSDVVEDERALDEWVEGAVSSILKSAPGAVAATKALLAELPDVPFSEGLSVAQARSAALFAGAEAAGGMDAFLQKRTPPWETKAP